MRRTLAILIVLAGMIQFCPAQGIVKDKNLLDSLLSIENYSEAASHLGGHLSFYAARKNYDSLATYPYYIGIIKHKTTDPAKGIKETESFISDLKAKGAGSRNLYKAYMSYVRYLDETGKTQRSYENTEKALEYAEKMPDKTLEETGHIIYNLGASALSMGNYDLAGKHFREALKQYESYPKISQSKLADAYNAMGATMWLSTKLDSARMFYDKSVQSIKRSDADSITKKYLTAVTLSNVALIQQGQGKTTEAVETLKKTLENYNEVILHSKNSTHINKARVYKWNAMTNLAVFYNDIGNYTLANKLIERVLVEQIKELDPKDPRIFKTRVMLGQSLMSLQRYPEAKTVFNEAYKGLEASPSQEFYWKAITLFGLAETSDALGKIQEANEYYSQSGSFFERILKDGYDRQYLNFLVKHSSFLAEHGEKDKAETIALKGYKYTAENAKNNAFVQFKQLLNLADVYYKIGNITESEVKSKDALQLINNIQSTGSLVDSVQVEFQKPKAILINAQSAYLQGDKRDSLFLKKLYNRIQKTVFILERQKSIAVTPENISALLENNKEVFEFIKKLGMELYLLTGNQQYLKNTLGYHESGLYYKIRSRLNKRNELASYGLPPEIKEKENRLKENIQLALEQKQEEGLKSFFEATREWNSFLKYLKNEYPKYYKMRYETISETALSFQKNLDKNTSVVRYMFIGKELYAFVITKNSLKAYPLKYAPVKDVIHNLNRGRKLEEEWANLHLLYKNIWQPFAHSLENKNIIIVPDGELFNLSFETLVEKKVNSPKDFVTNSLLSKHIISYNFSLLLLQGKNKKEFKTNFVAFAPGFVDEMKEDYLKKANASTLDNSYLSILPQPFTLDLVNSLKKRYTGTSYIHQASTLSNFKKNGRDVKILHIGTHAESNNISPGFSRLFFAKDPAIPNESNYLYANEIYNQDFSSHLAVLTACETGKPNYQAGEGMISLAHAFHYAGSESLLTGIWKIDEQVSTIIMAYFYDHLSKGLSKPEALRNAKLDYLENAKGRAVSPEYWAGMVLIGDPSPVALRKKSNAGLWGAGILILVGLYWFKRRSNKRRNAKYIDRKTA